MSTRLRHANSTSGKLLRAPANVPLLMLVLATAAALHAQSVAPSDEQPPTGTYSLLYSFQCSPDGAYPQGGLVRDSSGNLYGTTSAGGSLGEGGTVFRLTPSGTETILHSFGGVGDGFGPLYGTLAMDASGNLYGTTYSGMYGTVFKVTATGTESVLYTFTGYPNGANPYGGVVRDSAGNLYGTTQFGGTNDLGIVFKLTPSGTVSVLHDFSLSATDGSYPSGNLTRDSAGNLYGLTESGGPSNAGTIYEVTPSGTVTLLYSIKGYPSDGFWPLGQSLLRDPSGNFLGVTNPGGAIDSGIVFKLTPAGTETVLLTFRGGNTGASPVDGLAEDASGNLYGTTDGEGSGLGCPIGGCGVLFKLSPSGTETVLHAFVGNSPSDGTNPLGGVIRDSTGNLYGTLYEGGAHGCGAVFKFTP